MLSLMTTERTPQVRMRRIAGTAMAATALAVAFASPASAASTTVGDWRMGESAGAKIMNDSSSNNKDGAVGSKVLTGVPYGTGKGFLYTEPASTVADRSYLATVAHTATLNPSDRSMHITMEVTTTDSNANLLQKGQAGTGGGYYKMEINSGRPACSFAGSVRQRLVTWGSSITDGKPHVITCDKYADRVRISVDGQPAVIAWNGVGSIYNYKALSIGGKYECDAKAVDCDYFTGTLGSAKITFD